MVDLPYVEIQASADEDEKAALKKTIELEYDSHHKRILITVDLDASHSRYITYWFPVKEFRAAVAEAILKPAFTARDFDENIGYYARKIDGNKNTLK